MVGKTKPAAPAQSVRMDTIARFCGCLPCLLEGLLDVHATIQHVCEGYRLGHRFTYGSCEWHHLGRGVGIGPSMAITPHKFHVRYGSERALVKVQDFMLDLFADNPWEEYAVRRQVARDVRNHWTELNHAAQSQSFGK